MDAQEGLATKSDLRELHSDLALTMAQLDARLTRLFWLQLAVHTAATAALMAVALAIAAVLWG